MTASTTAYLLDGGAPITLASFRLTGGIALILWLTSTYIRYPDRDQPRAGRSNMTIFLVSILVNTGGILVFWEMLQFLEGTRVHFWHKLMQ